ncbi:MAG: hypothetical protein AAFO07_32270 [Bacteroidota bacterium]
MTLSELKQAIKIKGWKFEIQEGETWNYIGFSYRKHMWCWFKYLPESGEDWLSFNQVYSQKSGRINKSTIRGIDMKLTIKGILKSAA